MQKSKVRFSRNKRTDQRKSVQIKKCFRKFYPELIDEVFNFCSLVGKIKLGMTCKKFYKRLPKYQEELRYVMENSYANIDLIGSPKITIVRGPIVRAMTTVTHFITTASPEKRSRMRIFLEGERNGKSFIKSYYLSYLDRKEKLLPQHRSNFSTELHHTSLVNPFAIYKLVEHNVSRIYVKFNNDCIWHPLNILTDSERVVSYGSVLEGIGIFLDLDQHLGFAPVHYANNCVWDRDNKTHLVIAATGPLVFTF